MSRVDVCQNSLTPWENNDLNFRLACDQVVLFETAANLCASGVKHTIFSQLFFFYFELGVSLKQNLLSPLDPVINIST